LFKIHHTNAPESVGTTELVNYPRSIGDASVMLRHYTHTCMRVEWIWLLEQLDRYLARMAWEAEIRFVIVCVRGRDKHDFIRMFREVDGWKYAYSNWAIVMCDL